MRRARARAPQRVHELLAPAATLIVGMHDREREPSRQVLAEPLRLQHRRRAVVAEHLVVVAEAQIRELAGR